MKNVAILLAAGSGSRMRSEVKKQFICINNRPLMSYSLEVFEHSEVIDSVILVTSGEDIDYCREKIVEAYGFTKVKAYVPGGRERYHSVMAGLDAIASLGGADYVFIHDAARPCIDEEMLVRLYDEVRVSEACVAAVKSKDTVKIANNSDYVVSTPNRNLTWIVQTPQVFSYALIKEAYQTLLREEDNLLNRGIKITDDAMVVETFSDHPVKLTEGSYYNVKITTPEDLVFASEYAKNLSFRNL